MTLWSLCRISNILYDICQIAFFGGRRPKSRPLKRDNPQKLEFIFCVPGVFTGPAPYSPPSAVQGSKFNVQGSRFGFQLPPMCSKFDVRCSRPDQSRPIPTMNLELASNSSCQPKIFKLL